MRDDHAAEARDEYVTKLDNVLYIIIAPVNIKTTIISRKQTKFETKREVEKKYTIPTFLLIS